MVHAEKDIQMTAYIAPHVDLPAQILAFEEDELSTADTLELFANLVYTGLAWQLQGFYGRTAANLIEAGYITPDGRLTDKVDEL